MSLITARRPQIERLCLRAARVTAATLSDMRSTIVSAIGT